MTEELTVSYLLSTKRAGQAVAMVRPAILAAMESGLMKRTHLHIVVMNPATQPLECEDPFEAVLYEESFGNKDDWEHDYQRIALAKAVASWRTGMPTHLVRETMPYLLIASESWSDTKHYGSAVLQGLVVASSGVQPWFDEWVSYMVAAACRALCISVMQEEMLSNKERDFLWQHNLDGITQGSR